MMPLGVRIVFGVIGTISCITLCHWAWCAVRDPERLLECVQWRSRNDRGSATHYQPWQGKLYVGLAVLGWGVVAFGGFRLLFGWMPTSWGGVDEYGEFYPHVDGIAATLCVFSFVLMSEFYHRTLELHWRRKVQESLEAENQRLKRDLASARSQLPAKGS